MNLPQTLSIGSFEPYDILEHGIPTTGIRHQRRSVEERDIRLIASIAERPVTADMLSEELLVSLVIVCDVMFSLCAGMHDDFSLPENKRILYSAAEHKLVVDGEYLTKAELLAIVLPVNEIYKQYRERLRRDGNISTSIVPGTSSLYGECHMLQYRGELSADVIKRITLKKLSVDITPRYLTIGKIRTMANSLITQSMTDDQPTIRLLKNTRFIDLSMHKYKDLLDNAVVQVETNMDYSTDVVMTEPFIETDYIRSILSRNHRGFFQTLMGANFSPDYLKMSDNKLYYSLNIAGMIRCIDVVALAAKSMTMAYLPVQKVVEAEMRKINVMLMSAFFEAFGCIALINQHNTSKPVRLLIKYPSTATKDEFCCIMMPMVSILRKRQVDIYFYDTDEDMLKSSMFAYEVIN